MTGGRTGTALEGDPFSEAESLLAQCQTELDALHLDTEEDKKVLVAVVYARAIHLFRGLLVVLRAGHVYPGRVVARALLESVFIGVALVRDKRTLGRYVESSEVVRQKWINSLLNSPTVFVPGLSRRRLRVLKAEVDANVEEHGLKDLNVEDFARWAKMHDIYLREYSLWSLTTHASVGDFKDHFAIDEHGDLTAIDLHHSPAETTPVLSTCSLAFLKLHHAVAQLFELDVSALEKKFEPFFASLHSRSVLEDGGDQPL
jgi:hypothetical protein